MIIFLQIIFVKTCTVPNQVYNLYPTEGERIEKTIDQLIQGSNLTFECYNCQQQGASVYNIFNSTHHQLINSKFKSVSVVNDIVYALTTEPSLNIYQYQNGKIELKHQTNISSILECFSVQYTEIYNIIIDCYNDQQLILYSLIRDSQLIQIYTTNSSTPNQTKIGSVVKNTSKYIIYGQYFNYFNKIDSFSNILNLTILSKNKSYQLIVKDNLQINAYNFFVSQRIQINQTIFIQYYNNISSYVLQENGTLLQVQNIQIIHEIINMAYYYSQIEYDQFDRLFLIVLDDDFDYMYFITVFYSDSFYVDIVESKQQRNIVSRFSQIFISSNFIIIYSNYTISILKNERFNQVLFKKEYVTDNKTVIHFDEIKEILSIFGNNLITHQLQIPVLNFFSNKSQGNFSIFALEIDDYFKIHYCNVMITFQQVSKSDNKVYFIFDQPQQAYFNLLQFPFEYWFGYVSGPLVIAKSNVSNPELGYFHDQTTQKTNDSIQSDKQYYITKAFSINLFQECESKKFSCVFMVAVSQQNMDIYQEGILNSSNQITYMNINVTQIEITFSISNQQLVFIICLGFGQNIIQLYQYNSQLQYINNITLNNETFKQFQLLSNSVVLLLESNEIETTSFENKRQILFNSQILEQDYTQKVELNLINIYINQQYQSRVIYINNNNSFIIGFITEQLEFKFISLQGVIFQIQNLVVVNYLLILSWIPQYEEVIFFEVWDVKNLTQPFYLKQMQSQNFGLNQNSISYYSDNQFFYVLDSSTIYVYNPYLLGRSSLYYRLEFDGNYFTSVAIDSVAFLCFNQSFYLLSPILLQAFYNNSTHDNFLIQQVFNFTFSSYFDDNPLQQGNSSLTIINNYIIINLKNSNVSVNKSQSYVVIGRNNISFTGQALQFQLGDKNDGSKVVNNIEYSSQQNYSVTYNQIIQYNKSFLLMNNSSIYNYTINLTYALSPAQKLCIASAVSNQIIYALCQDIQQKYQIITIILPNTTIDNNTTQMVFPVSILDLQNQTYKNTSWIRIQNNYLYIWNDTVYMYNINKSQQQQQQQGQFICQCTQFGFQNIEITVGNLLAIVYIYFKPIHKDQLYYKFAMINNDSSFSHGDENSIILKSITDQYLSFDTIPMIQHYGKEIFLMVSNSNFNLIITLLLAINKQNITNSQLIQQSIIQTSPPYDKHNFNVSQLPQYDSKLLLFIYSNTQNTSNQTHMITFYNMSNNKNITNINFQNPLLFEGGYNFTLNQTVVNAFSFIAMNISSGQILLLFNNGSILELSLNIFSINLSLSESKSGSKAPKKLIAYNFYNAGYAYITFHINSDHLFDHTSIYILFGITAIVLVISILVYHFQYESEYDSDVDPEDEL